MGFFLTALPRIMHFLVSKQAERPVYSCRLSIVHFWALIILYIWAGPHHLHYKFLRKKPQCDALSQTVRSLGCLPFSLAASIFLPTRRPPQNYKAKPSIQHIGLM